MGAKEAVSKLLYYSGGLKLLNLKWKNNLTVLAYHRIDEVKEGEFNYFIPNIAATPEQFREQMEYVAQHYQVVSLEQVRDFIYSDIALPDKPLLITFDDGYLDNFQYAYPILSEFGFAAVIFIITGRMTDSGPLWWDELAYYFHYTKLNQADLPWIGLRSWQDNDSKMDVMFELLTAIKLLSESEKHRLLKEVPNALEVAELKTEEHRLFMNWDQVRELYSKGIRCEPHTVTHPIMSRIDHEQAQRELAQSRQDIIDQAGYEPIAFAYPNGMPGDFSSDTIELLKETHYQLAFTLSPGPMPLEELKAHPYEIKRMFLGYWDSREVFAAKLAGLPALIHSYPYVEESLTS